MLVSLLISKHARHAVFSEALRPLLPVPGRSSSGYPQGTLSRLFQRYPQMSPRPLPQAAVTKYCTWAGGLREQKLVFSQIWNLTVQNQVVRKVCFL